MKVQRYANHRHLQKEQSPLSITANSKPDFKISPCLQKYTTSCLPSSPSSTMTTHIQAIATTMKLRMKAAINTMVCNGNHHNLSASFKSPHEKRNTDPSTTTITTFTQQPPRKLNAASLLKAYLHFVQEETGATLNFESSSSILMETSLYHQSHPLASSGAALIESLVHGPILNSKLYNQTNAMDRPITTVASGGQRIKKSKRKQQQPRRTTTINKNLSSKASSMVTRCICANPHDEFGSMVQCDDCFYWLHLDCLDLNEDLLGDTFQCPSCCTKLSPRITSWRRSAQWESKRLKYSSTSEEDDDDDDDDKLSDYDMDLVSSIPRMTIDSSIRTRMTTPTGNVLVEALSQRPHENDMDEDEDILDSETVESDWENENEPSDEQSELYISTTPPLITSPIGDTDSSCEVDTPGGPLDNNNNRSDTPVDFINEPLLNSTATMPCLDQESLFWLSHLSYLESLQSSSRRRCFTSHASDVFLCDGDLPHKLKQHTEQDSSPPYPYILSLVTNTLPSRADPPSTICSNYLSEYSFDEGPFWSPCR